MDQNQIETIALLEKKYNFTYPKLYKEINASGFLNWNSPHKNWYKEVYPLLKKSPPFLLYAKDFEILNLVEIKEELERFNDPDDYRRTNPEFKFVPFAITGAGDLFCFFYEKEKQDNPPVVLVWHDCEDAEYKAQNLEDFIFRQLLEIVENIDEDDLILDDNFEENCSNLYNSHKHLLSIERQNRIAAIYKRSLGNYKYKFKNKEYDSQGLLSEDELDLIFEEQFNTELWKQKFDYTLPDIAIEITESNQRRIGRIVLKITPIPPKESTVHTPLKALNWRLSKNESKTELEYYRNQFVFFGIPSLSTIDSTFKDKLIDLKTNYNGVSISFHDDETKINYEL